eukprot:scaffold31139_cov53-Phaeocystis_antarctica.AAC.5
MAGPERGGVGVAGRFGVGGELLAWRRGCAVLPAKVQCGYSRQSPHLLDPGGPGPTRWPACSSWACSSAVAACVGTACDGVTVRAHRHGMIDLDAAHCLDRLHPLVEFVVAHGCCRAVDSLRGTRCGCAHTGTSCMPGIMHASNKMRARSMPASVSGKEQVWAEGLPLGGGGTKWAAGRASRRDDSPRNQKRRLPKSNSRLYSANGRRSVGHRPEVSWYGPMKLQLTRPQTGPPKRTPAPARVNAREKPAPRRRDQATTGAQSEPRPVTTEH